MSILNVPCLSEWLSQFFLNLLCVVHVFAWKLGTFPYTHLHFKGVANGVRKPHGNVKHFEYFCHNEV